MSNNKRKAQQRRNNKLGARRAASGRKRNKSKTAITDAFKDAIQQEVANRHHREKQWNRP
ncbi:MAG: hypothetical protein ACR2PR_09235 [Pseudohongiellaceae bacterium]